MECLLINKINDSDVWSIKRKNASAEVRYNSKTQSLRILAEEKHVYFLERTGLIRTRITVHSEYGQHEGEIFFSSMRQGGTIRIHEHKFSFQYRQGTLFLQDENNEPIASLSESVVKDTDLFELSGLLFAAVKLSHITVPTGKIAI
jgi:hypothetical protein